MPILFNKPLPKLGVEDFHFAKLLTDTTGEALPTYDAPQRVPGLTQVGFNPNANTAAFYADNGVYESAAQTGDLVLTLGMADIPPDIRSIWFGHEYVDGLLKEGQISPPDIAVGYRIKKSNSAYRYVWIYKCKAAPPAETADTQGSSIAYQSDSMTFNCASLVTLRAYRQILDDDDPNLPVAVTKEIIFNGWFTSPVWKPGEVI